MLNFTAEEREPYVEEEYTFPELDAEEELDFNN